MYTKILVNFIAAQHIKNLCIAKKYKMKNISKKTKILSLISVSLWIIGSLIIYMNDKNSNIIIVSAVVIIAGIYSQINKDHKVNTGLS